MHSRQSFRAPSSNRKFHESDGFPSPSRVRDIYRHWRPTPLYRALRLEKALGTPARIYYKYEGISQAGSHKPNTAVAQAHFNHLAGVHLR
jgi:tryptophan synthase beta chain